jgi:hypothetical protein
MTGDVSSRELTQQVWDEVAAERALRPAPSASLSAYEPLLEDTERHYVNTRYVLDRTPLAGDSGGGGLLRAIRQKLRARAARFVIHTLRRYLDDEQEFLVHLVRLQNTVAVRVDTLGEEIRQVETLLRRECEMLRCADTALHAHLEHRLGVLEDEIRAWRMQTGGIRE